MRFRQHLVSTLVLSVAAFSVSTVFASESREVLPAPHKAFDCATCHGTTKPSNIPDNKACLGCHGPMEKLVEATSKYTLNPHMSPHWGADIPCGTCHKQHEKPTVQCAACHKNQNYKAR